MKQSTIATKIMIAVLCLGVAVYLAVYFVRGWQDNLVTTYAYAYTLDVGQEAAGILVREERALTGSGGYVDELLPQGAKAAVGDAVALVYSDPSALTTRQSIRVLESEIEQLEYALSSGTQAGTQTAAAAQLDGQVLASIVSLRALTAGGDLTGLEESALNLRSMVFKRDYAYGDTDAAGELSALIADRRAQLAQLNRSLDQVSRTVYAPVSGVWSAGADGWEGTVTPAMLDALTAEGLDELLHQRREADANAVGKLVTGSTWYFAALLDGIDTGLQSGRTYTLSFSGDYYGQIPMKLERVDLEGERTLVVFSCRAHLADTAMLRIQTVDVVVRQIDGIRVPRKALRVETEDVTAKDGTVSQVNRYGVYTVVRSQAQWQEVEVLYTDDNFYLVRPANEGASKRLRAGDEVILNSSGIYDGKVVR